MQELRLDVSNIPTEALKSWLDAHFYYLPENTVESFPIWANTFVILKDLLEERGIKTNITFETQD